MYIVQLSHAWSSTTVYNHINNSENVDLRHYDIQIHDTAGKISIDHVSDDETCWLQDSRCFFPWHFSVLFYLLRFVNQQSTSNVRSDSSLVLLQIFQMMNCLLIICASFLCTTSATAAADASVPASSLFPSADMSLKLAFDLTPPALLAPRSEQCFPFFPNTQFQGVWCWQRCRVFFVDN